MTDSASPSTAPVMAASSSSSHRAPHASSSSPTFSSSSSNPTSSAPPLDAPKAASKSTKILVRSELDATQAETPTQASSPSPSSAISASPKTMLLRRPSDSSNAKASKLTGPSAPTAVENLEPTANETATGPSPPATSPRTRLRSASSEGRSAYTSLREVRIDLASSLRIASEPGKQRSSVTHTTGDDEHGSSADGSSDGGPERPRTPSATSTSSLDAVDATSSPAAASASRAREATITSPSDDSVEAPALDHALLSALQNPRDRILLLRAEVEMERFVSHPTASRLPLSPPHFQPNLNSYQRLLIHRLADVFGITREVEAAPMPTWAPPGGPTPGIVVLVKGPATRMPSAKLAMIVPPPPSATLFSPALTSMIPSIVSSGDTSSSQQSAGSESPARETSPSSSSSNLPMPLAQPQVFKILPRSTPAPGSEASSSVGGGDDDLNGRNKAREKLTLEEREAAYKEARERIFAQQAEVKPSPLTSSVVTEGGAPGLTRPSSAGSTYSRSSAAASIAGGRAESTTSSYHSGYHHGPPSSAGSMFYPIPSSASSSSSLLSRSSLAASLRPSAPSFDPSMGWTPPGYEHDPYQQHQPQQYYTGGPPPPPPGAMGYAYGQPPVQGSGPAQMPPRAPYASPPIGYPAPPPPLPAGHVPYPQPSYAPSSLTAAGYGMPSSAWATPRPAAALPSPALSMSSGGSHGHGNLGAAHSSMHRGGSGGDRDPGYLMRFPEGGVVPYSGSSTGTASTNSSQASLPAIHYASTTARSTSNSSRSSHPGGVPSESGRTGGRTHGGGSSRSSIASIEGTQQRRTLDREGTLKGKGKEATNNSINETTSGTDALSASNLRTLHPSLPAKPEWAATRRSSSSVASKEDGSTSVISSPSPPVVLPHPQATTTNGVIGPAYPLPTGYGTPSGFYPSPSGGGASSSSYPIVPTPPPPPPSSAIWYPPPHNEGGYYPSAPLGGGQTNSGPGAYAIPSPVPIEMRRPPPRSTELFDPSKPLTPQQSTRGKGPSLRGRGGLEKGVEGLRL